MYWREARNTLQAERQLFFSRQLPLEVCICSAGQEIPSFKAKSSLHSPRCTHQPGPERDNFSLLT